MRSEGNRLPFILLLLGLTAIAAQLLAAVGFRSRIFWHTSCKSAANSFSRQEIRDDFRKCPSLFSASSPRQSRSLQIARPSRIPR